MASLLWSVVSSLSVMNTHLFMPPQEWHHTRNELEHFEVGEEM